MNVSLTPVMEKFVHDQVKSGLYSNASEVVRVALRGLIVNSGHAKELFIADIAAGRRAIAAGDFSKRKINDIIRSKRA